MLIPEPFYFETNREWYTFDEKNCMLVLTDKATPEAKESYDEYIRIFFTDYLEP